MVLMYNENVTSCYVYIRIINHKRLDVIKISRNIVFNDIVIENIKLDSSFHIIMFLLYILLICTAMSSIELYFEFMYECQIIEPILRKVCKFCYIQIQR